jgi:hypothetical protein
VRATTDLVLAVLAFVPLMANAGSCDAVYNAGIKTVQTPHRLFSTNTRNGKATSSETVFADGVEYYRLDGRWQRSLMTAKEMLAAAEEKLKAQPDTCVVVEDDIAEGQAIAVYQVRNSEMESESRVRVFKGSGLLQGQSAGVVGQSAMETRYEYSDVKAPSL